MNSVNCIKQFTINYRSKTYTIFEFTISAAFKHLNKHSGMQWPHFIRYVSNKPQKVTKDMVFIKTRKVNIIMINKFNKLNHVPGIKYHSSIGKVAGIESPYLSVKGPKPQRLILSVS